MNGAPALFESEKGPTAGPFYALLGRCPVKGCPSRARVPLPDTVTKRHQSRHGAHYSYDYDAPALVLPLDPRPGGARALDAAELIRRQLLPHCVEHRRPLRYAELRGTLDENKPCNARCMGATGPSCECSCAGRNHGGRWG